MMISMVIVVNVSKMLFPLRRQDSTMNVAIVQYNSSLQCPDMSRISVFHEHDHVILLDVLVVYYGSLAPVKLKG